MEAPKSLCLETTASFPGTLEKQEMWEVTAGPLEEKPGSSPHSSVAAEQFNSNALVSTSHGKAVTPSRIHFQHEPTLYFSISLNKWIVFAGNTHLKWSGKRLILARASSVGTCVPYL